MSFRIKKEVVGFWQPLFLRLICNNSSLNFYNALILNTLHDGVNILQITV